MTGQIISKNGISIRLPGERWHHILEEHGELLGMAEQVMDTVANPSRIVFYYDQAADVLYINFKKPSVATDSELTDNDIVIRYEGEEVIGLTILHVGQRSPFNAFPNSVYQ